MKQSFGTVSACLQRQPIHHKAVSSTCCCVSRVRASCDLHACTHEARHKHAFVPIPCVCIHAHMDTSVHIGSFLFLGFIHACMNTRRAQPAFARMNTRRAQSALSTCTHEHTMHASCFSYMHTCTHDTHILGFHTCTHEYMTSMNTQRTHTFVLIFFSFSYMYA